MKTIGWEGGVGSQIFEWTRSNGVWCVEYEIGKGNLYLFPNWHVVQNEKFSFLENFLLHLFKTIFTILSTGLPSLWCQRLRLDMELWLQWTKFELDLVHKLAM